MTLLGRNQGEVRADTSGRRPRRPLHLPLFLALLGIALVSCGDDDDPSTPCPTYEIGGVAGRVTAGGSGARVVVGARPEFGVDRGRVAYKAETDSSGWYQIDLPSGVYRFELDPVATAVYIPHARDTISIGRSIRRLDFERGKVLVHVQMPAGFEGRRFNVWLQGDSVSTSRSGSFLVAGGWLEALFPIVGIGNCRVAVVPVRSFGIDCWLPGVATENDADLFSVAADQPTVIEASLVDGWASISGTVTGSWQESRSSSPDLYAVDAEGVRLAFAEAAEDGSFTIDLFEAHSARLQVVIGEAERWIGGDGFDDATTFDVQPGDHLTGISHVEGGISCELRGPGNRIGQRTEFLIEDEAGRVIRSRGTVESPIEIHNLRAGRYRLRLSGACNRETWGSQWFDRAETREEATWIEVVEGQLTRITAHLEEGGRIEGVVMARDGQPLATLVQMSILDSSRQPMCGMISWSHGDFAYPGLSDGLYYLRCATQDSTWYYPGVADPDSAEAIEVRDHASVHVEWLLPVPGKREEGAQ